jgi:hypothetical protein
MCHDFVAVVEGAIVLAVHTISEVSDFVRRDTGVGTLIALELDAEGQLVPRVTVGAVTIVGRAEDGQGLEAIRVDATTLTPASLVVAGLAVVLLVLVAVVQVVLVYEVTARRAVGVVVDATLADCGEPIAVCQVIVRVRIATAIANEEAVARVEAVIAHDNLVVAVLVHDVQTKAGDQVTAHGADIVLIADAILTHDLAVGGGASLVTTDELTTAIAGDVQLLEVLVAQDLAVDYGGFLVGNLVATDTAQFRHNAFPFRPVGPLHFRDGVLSRSALAVGAPWLLFPVSL